MTRILVIGCPGSGKSTFARALRDTLGLPLYHLDMLYWNADRTTVSKEVFRERLDRVLHEDAWIIDGNFSSTMELRLSVCDTVFFLDYPTEVCLEGVTSRMGKPREDMPWIEVTEDAEFTAFIKNFHKERRPQILELLSHHSDKENIVFRSREESAQYLEKLKEQVFSNS